MADFKWTPGNGGQAIVGVDVDSIIVFAADDGVAIHSDSGTTALEAMAGSFCRMLKMRGLLDSAVAYAQTASTDQSFSEVEYESNRNADEVVQVDEVVRWENAPRYEH